jgi:hypothetical protein
MTAFFIVRKSSTPRTRDKTSKRHSRTNKGTNLQPISKAIPFVFLAFRKDVRGD